jgi:phage shock protein A
MYMPASRSTQDPSPTVVYPRYDGELIALRRRIAILEDERSASNRAMNELLLHASALERRLHDALAALQNDRARFAAYVAAECAAAASEKDRLTARIAELRASPAWSCERFIRTLRARFR